MMLLSRSVVSVVLAALVLGAVTAGGATAATVPASETARDRGEDALAEVVAAFGPAPRTMRGAGQAGGRDVTMAMLQLHRHLEDLAPADREIAKSYLARPTDGAVAEEVAYAKDANPTVQCGPKVCVTYAQATRDAPDLTKDVNGNGVPDQVDLTLATLGDVWTRIVTKGRYRAPLPDAGPTRGEGPDQRFDVYLADIGQHGIYGYCIPDEVTWAVRAASGYCVLDDDYSSQQFGSNTPKENLQVTVAHEFFHAVQFAYDSLEDIWFMEGSAAWVEDELFDEVNDNLYYLRNSPMTHPRVSMDDADALRNRYGSWIWWRFLGERHPRENGTGLPTIMRDIWIRSAFTSPAKPGTYSTRATADILATRGDTLRTAVGRFFETNRHPRTFYEEGRSYPTAPATAAHRIWKGKRSVTSRVVLDQLSGATVAFVPHSSLVSSRWRLEVKVTGPAPSRGSVAHVTVRRTNGAMATSLMQIDRSGKGRATLPFSARSVKSVELTAANGSHRFQCNRGTPRSCAGKPLDHRLTTAFTATLRWR